MSGETLSYGDALAWLYGFSDTERTGKFTGKFSRDREDNIARMRALLSFLDDPQRAYGVTHIAGTKGKGSTAALLTSILRAAGVPTGLYTQPDLHTFRERIQLDGRVISEAEVTGLIPTLRAATEALDPALGSLITYDVGTALAFLAFREAGMRHAVVEVGLGGRLDATNVVDPMATAITSISYDHMEVLGHTLAEIAREKAGIIKPGVPILTSARAPEALEVIARIAAERDAPLVHVGPEGATGCSYTYAVGAATSEGQIFSVHGPHGAYADLELGLLGEHQIENATLAVALAETLREAGLPITEAAIRRGLREARWPARLQVVGRAPWIVVDAAHNADSVTRLLAALRRHFAFERLILVIGVLADKDLSGIVTAIAEGGVDLAIATTVASPRALPATAISEALQKAAPELETRVYAGSAAALAEALSEAGPSDLICVTGSVYFAGEALRWLAGRPEVTAGAIEIAGVDH
ncbi:MAG TPA: folylpolyglutamate synthase/dihydrofolate synthase family protein [Ktedonobacterales bacterium]|nr:folylpolyglutamate synthase/dihydrofolate synthase family protein [Ktedonobacterales bacterium]